MSVAVDREQAFLTEVGRIAQNVAAVHADAVDRDARFPAEALAVVAVLGQVHRAVRGHGDGVRHAPDPGRDDRASSRLGLV